MLVGIFVAIYFLDGIGSGPFLLPLVEDKDLKVIDGEFVRQAFRVLSDYDYNGTITN